MRVNRMAPPFFARSPAEGGAHSLWRGLKIAFVPMGAVYFYDVLTGKRPIPNGHSVGSATAGACGPAVRFVNAGLFADPFTIDIPRQAPYSVFSFLVRHDSSASLQALFGGGALSVGGWTFELNYGAGQIGQTRWGIADEATTTLGAVPIGTPSAVAMSHDGSTARFMLNGKFESVASGQPVSVAPTARIACASNSGGSQILPVQDASIHVLYCWNRPVADHEFLRLWMDPWAPVRPSRGLSFAGVAGAASTARSFAAMIG